MKCYSLGHNLKAHLKSHRDLNLKSHRDSDIKSHRDARRDDTLSWRCKQCKQQFQNEADYKQHVNSYHGDSKQSDGLRGDKQSVKNTKLPMASKPAVHQSPSPPNVNNLHVVESKCSQTVLHVKYITPRSAGNSRQVGGIQSARLEQVQPSGSEVQTGSNEVHPIMEKSGISSHSETQHMQNRQTAEFGKNNFTGDPTHQDQIADKLTPPSMLRMLPLPPPPPGPPGAPSSLPPPPVGPPPILPPPPPSHMAHIDHLPLGALASQMYPMTAPHPVTSQHSMTSLHPVTSLNPVTSQHRMTPLHSMTPQLQLLTPVNTDDLPPSQHQPMELVVTQEGQPPIEIPVVSANEQVSSSGQLTTVSTDQIAYL